MNWKAVFVVVGALTLTIRSDAGGRQYCGGQEVPISVGVCPDGSRPRFVANSVQREETRRVEPFVAKPVEQYRAREIEPYKAELIKRSERPNCDLNLMFGREWELFIPSSGYVTENASDGSRLLHTSPGSLTPMVVQISADGSYVWKLGSNNFIRGRWVTGEKTGYSVALERGYERKRWNASMEWNSAEKECRLLMWDGISLAGQLRGR
ncbi:MAG: hypothetical protein WCI59_18670 [Betaproteobacteria bacterium]